MRKNAGENRGVFVRVMSQCFRDANLPNETAASFTADDVVVAAAAAAAAYLQRKHPLTRQQGHCADLFIVRRAL